LTNELRELKATEKSLIGQYKNNFEGKMNLESSVASQVFAEEKGTTKLSKSISLQPKMARSKTMSKLENPSVKTMTNLEPIQSLNDLGLDLEGHSDEEKLEYGVSPKSSKRLKKATTVTFRSPKHSEDASLAKSVVFGSNSEKKSLTFIHPSLTEINLSKRNLNEHAYNEVIKIDTKRWFY